MAKLDNPSVCPMGSQLPLHRGALSPARLAAEICDHYCRFPREAREGDCLDEVCRECPMSRILELIR